MRRAPAPIRRRPVRCAQRPRISWSRRTSASPRTATARTCCSRSASATRIPAGWRRNWRAGWVARCVILALPASRIDARSPSSGFRYPRRRIRWRLLPGFENPEFAVLEVHRHRRKLPRGALAGNRFAIRIRNYTGTGGQLQERCESIGRFGVPNYFGPQRFGREASNLSRLAAPRSGRPDGFVLSAARSLIFNAVLGERVRQGSWGTLAPGDVANLDGRGSVFPVAELTPDLPHRLAQQELHPTGPMWGLGELMTRGAVRELEQRIGAQLAEACRVVSDAGLRQERRSLRLKVRDLTWQTDRRWGGAALLAAQRQFCDCRIARAAERSRWMPMIPKRAGPAARTPRRCRHRPAGPRQRPAPAGFAVARC